VSKTLTFLEDLGVAKTVGWVNIQSQET